MQSNKHLNWLKRWQHILSIGKIEEELKMPTTTLHQWLGERRELPKKWVEPLTEFVKEVTEIK